MAVQSHAAKQCHLEISGFRPITREKIFLGIYKNNSDSIYPAAQRHLKWSDHQNIHERGIAA